MSVDQDLLVMEQISKSFPGVRALDDVTLDVRTGEVHALVGENGAGKSTLMKILMGALPKDSGTIRLDGAAVSIQNPSDALALGISMIYQELTLIPYLTVGQNIYLGREPLLPLRRIDWKTLYDRADEQLQRMHIELDPQATVADLAIAQQQMVEIAKALSLHARLIVMDEPTSSLTERESERLFDLIRALKQEGVTIIYISHRLEEIFEIADRVTVLRDGKNVGTLPVAEATPADLVRRMVGRDIQEMFQKKEAEKQNVVLEIKHLSGAGCLRDISLQLRRGEILGLAGLVGSGRSTLSRVLFGAQRAEQGELWIEGQRVTIDSPETAIRHGVGLVPEDRKSQALFLNMAVEANIVISALPHLARAGVVDYRRAHALAREYSEKLDIRTPSLRQLTKHLSGGNQQKTVIARWLTLNPRILILDEPTRGIDVGAKAEIHALMSQLAQQGVGILMVSSELPEVLGVSDRILVMREGRVVGEFGRDEATEDKIMLAATGTAP